MGARSTRAVFPLASFIILRNIISAPRQPACPRSALQRVAEQGFEQLRMFGQILAEVFVLPEGLCLRWFTACKGLHRCRTQHGLYYWGLCRTCTASQVALLFTSCCNNLSYILFSCFSCITGKYLELNTPLQHFHSSGMDSCSSPCLGDSDVLKPQGGMAHLSDP